MALKVWAAFERLLSTDLNGNFAKIPRIGQIGGFTADNVPASQTDVQVGRFVTTQTANYIARPIVGKAGRVVKFSWRRSAGQTAGNFTVRLQVNSALTTMKTLTAASGSTGLETLATPVAFAAGDSLSIAVTTDAAYAPVTLDYAFELIVEYDAD